jgi:hypothetical protein
MFSLLFIMISFGCVGSTPCGVRHVCNCWGDGLNIVSCANKDLDIVPFIEKQHRRTAEILILDGNQLVSTEGLDLDDWPSLKELRVRTNPEQVCPYLKRMEEKLTSRGVSLIDDCTHESSPDETIIAKWQAKSTAHPTPPPSTQQTTSTPVDSITLKQRPRIIQAILQHTTMASETITLTVLPDDTTMETQQDRNITGRLLPVVYMTIDYDGITVKVVVPVGCFGIGCFIITLVWRRRNARRMELDVSMTRMGTYKPPKVKTSPTPSETSELMFDMLAMDRMQDRLRADQRALMRNRPYHGELITYYVLIQNTGKHFIHYSFTDSQEFIFGLTI